MKKLNNMILIEFLLSITLLLTCFSSPLNHDEDYRVFTKDQFAFAIFLICAFTLVHILEYVLDRHHSTKMKIVKSFALVPELIFLDILIVQNLDLANNGCIIISLLNIFFCLLHCVVLLYFANKRNSETGESVLPPFWYSFISIILYYVILAVIPLTGILLAVFLKFSNIWIRTIIFVLPLVILSLILTLFTNNKFSKICYKFESELDYSEYSKASRKMLQNKLNFETSNYIKIMDAYYEVGVNYKKAFTDLNNLTKETNEEKTIFYRDTALINCLILMKDVESFNKYMQKMDSKINSLKDGIKKEQLKIFKEKFICQKELYIDHKINNKTEELFSISSLKNSYNNIASSLYLAIYYYLKEDEENFKKYQENIELSKGNLPSYYHALEEFLESMMIKEKSCGAVVYKIEDNQIYVLLEHMVQGHTSIPKGHVEGDETEEETALREIKEETSLEVELDTGFRYQIAYSPKKNVIKDVIFFVAKALTSELVPQEIEVNSLEWVKIEDSISMLTFQTDKDTVKAAFKYLNNEEEY